jgi:Cof subfamily protein (haloacid dehalogenase superfamily)
MAVRLIALDIDGTLLDSRWQVPGANRLAIVEAAAQGIEIALVTGRRYDFALPVARSLDCPLTMIASNGALVRTDDGRTHLRHLLDRSTARQVLQATTKWRNATAVVFDRPLSNQVIYEAFEWNNEHLRAYYSRNREFLGQASPLENCLTEDPLQVMFAGSIEEMRAVEAALRATAFAGEFQLAITSYHRKDFGMIDVLNPRCSKGASLREWAEHRGYQREEILAIGDNHNDLEMLHFAGIAVVMGNSVPELKAFGWHETRSNDEGGVADAIERFVLRELRKEAKCV